MAVRIGELLLKEKLISPEQLQQALNQQKANGGKLGYNLVKMGFVKDEQITSLLSKQYGVPAISLAQFKIDPTIVKLVPTETARKYQMIPLSRSGSSAAGPGGPARHRVAMHGVRFDPDSLVVAVGDTVEWDNRDLVPHTSTAEDSSANLRVKDQPAASPVSVSAPALLTQMSRPPVSSQAL